MTALILQRGLSPCTIIFFLYTSGCHGSDYVDNRPDVCGMRLRIVVCLATNINTNLLYPHFKAFTLCSCVFFYPVRAKAQFKALSLFGLVFAMHELA